MKDNRQKDIENYFYSLDELFEILDLDKINKSFYTNGENNFKLKVPLAFVKKMKKADLNDPLLKQILPNISENVIDKNFKSDPIQESKFIKIPGLIHKYKTRVLLIISNTCPINCRFCFRKNFNFATNTICLKKENFDDVFNYIKKDSNINEIIFSGGEPLMKSDNFLKELSEKIATIKHAKTIRIHSRMPIILPKRITKNFITWFGHLKTNSILVTHCNHPNEIDKEVIKKCKLMKENNITLFNQTVLLKGVNDSAIILKDLSEKLFSASIIPYYVHLLDLVTGSKHFFVSDKKAKIIYEQLKELLPGYLVPKFVKDLYNLKSKYMI